MNEENKNIENIETNEEIRAEAAQEIRPDKRRTQDFSKGSLTLMQPIRSRSEDISVLLFDFNRVTGEEFAEAMDSDPDARFISKITNRQALVLFAAAAAHETAGVDAQDIRERLAIQDSIAATQLATLFFVTSARAANTRILSA